VDGTVVVGAVVEVGPTVVDVEVGLTVVDVEVGLTVVDVEVDGAAAGLDWNKPPPRPLALPR